MGEDDGHPNAEHEQMAAITNLSADPMIAASQRFDHYSAEARTYRRCAANAASINNRGAFRHFQGKARWAAGEARVAAAALRPAPVSSPADRLAPMAALLEMAGWELKNLEVEVGMGQSVLRMHIARYNEDRSALHVDLLVEGHLGRASISREIRYFNERAKNGKLWTGGWEYNFLGRDRYSDLRSALGAFEAYVEDNGNGRRLGRALTALLAA